MGYILYLALLLFVVIGVLIFTILYFTDNRDKLGGINKELNSIDTNTEKLNSIDTNTEKLNSIDTNTEKLNDINTELSNIDNQFVLNVSKGSVENYSVRNIFGWQESVPDNIGLIPLWEYPIAYPYPTPPGLSMRIISQASDDGGTVLIKGLDSDYNEITEQVTTSAGVPPVTTNLFYRINDVIFSSINGVNNEIINISSLGTNYAAIGPSVGRNQASIYTVPANHSFYLYRIDAFSNDTNNTKPSVFQNYVQKSNGSVYTVARTTFSGNMNIQRRLPFKYKEKIDIQFQLAPLTSNPHEMNVFGEGILVKEN